LTGTSGKNRLLAGRIIPCSLDDICPHGIGSAESVGVPGKPVLAPKVKEGFDKALKALNDNQVDQAEKHLDETAKLAPNHPDVL
jgi:hypothetical protein